MSLHKIKRFATNKLTLKIMGSLLILLFSLCNIAKLVVPQILPDEVGYWAAGAFFNGLDWSGIMQNSAYYNWGYGLLLAPLFVLKNPVIMYRAAIVLNSFLLVGTFWISCEVVRELMVKIDEKLQILLSLVVTLYTYNLFFSQSTQAEIVLLFLFWLAMFLLVKLIKSPSIIKSLFLALITMYMYAVHLRALGIIIAAFLCMLLLLLTKKIQWKHFLSFIAVYLSVFILVAIVKDGFIQAIYKSGEFVAINDFSGQTGKIMSLFSLHGLSNLAVGILGRLFYYGNASFFLVYWGLLSIGVDIFNSIKNPKDDDGSIIVKLFLLLSFLAGISISAISMIEPARLDTVMYGRYSENLIGPLMILGIIYLYNQKKRLKVHIIFSVIHIFLAYIIYQFYETFNLTVLGGIHVSGIMKFPTFSTISNPIFVTFMVASFSILIASMIVLICKNNIGQFIAPMLISGFWVFSALSYANDTFYLDKSSILEIANTARTISQNQTIYYTKESINESSGTLFDMYELRFLLPFSDIQTVSSDTIDTLSPNIIIRNKKSSFPTAYLDQYQYNLYYDSLLYSIYVKRGSGLEKELMNTELNANLKNFSTLNGTKISTLSGIKDYAIPDSYSLISDGTEEYLVLGGRRHLSPGNYSVKFELEYIDNGAHYPKNRPIAIADVVSNIGATMIASKDLFEDDFAENKATTVELNFQCSVEDNVEFRVFTEENVILRLNAISYTQMDSENDFLFGKTREIEYLQQILSLSGVEELPLVYAQTKGEKDPYIQFTSLQNALPNHTIDYVLGSVIKTPSFLIVEKDLAEIQKFLPEYTLLSRISNYALLVDSNYFPSLKEQGIRSYSEGEYIDLTYFEQGGIYYELGKSFLTIKPGFYSILCKVDTSESIAGDLQINVPLGKQYTKELIASDEDSSDYYTEKLFTSYYSGQMEVTINLLGGVEGNRGMISGKFYIKYRGDLPLSAYK